MSRVLLVDDSESNRYVISTWLRRAGHEVTEVATGSAALDEAATESFDLVLLDINLPDMTGYDVCERIKADPLTGSTPVLHLSATAIQPSDRSEGLRRGADGYLIEPVEREELLATVEALLRGAAAQKTALRLALLLRKLNEATLAMYEAVTLERLIATIAAQASLLFDSAAIVSVASNEIGYVASAIPGIDGMTLFEPCVPEAVDALRRTAADGVPVPASALGRFGINLERRIFLTAGLSEPGGQHGTIFVALPKGELRPVLAEETDVVLKQFARAAGTAIRNMRTFDLERQIALTLQQHLLPDVIAAIPGLDVAVRYKASAEHAEVGGDFYEIFALGERHVAIAIGDVVGHSLEAAAVMAQLRTAVRSYVLEGHDPATVLERLNGLLLKFHPDITATVCCAIFDLSTGRCEMANAGHPSPLVISGDQRTFLPCGGPLLGVDACVQNPHEAHAFDLAAGDVLLLYTDGLIERRGETIDDGFDRLAAVEHPAHGTLDALCDRALQTVGPRNMVDDIAIVAVRPTGP
jgi:CheY-like chemotaxis protein